MIIDITAWMDEFLQNLNHKFENRLWFVGLQGSYGRLQLYTRFNLKSMKAGFY